MNESPGTHHTSSIALSALLGGLTSLPLMALSFLGWRLAGLPFLPFDLFDWLVRTLPGDVVTLGIDTLVQVIDNLNQALNLGPTSSTAKMVEQWMALGIGMLGGASLGITIGRLTPRDSRTGWRVGVGVGLVVWSFVSLIELDLGLLDTPLLALPWLALLMTGWGACLGYLLNIQIPSPSDRVRADRRAALIKIAGGSALVTLGAWGLGQWLSAEPEETGAGQPLPQSTVDLPLPQVTATVAVRDWIAPAPGTRPELTPNKDFYRIDINTWPVKIDGETWELKVEGSFDNPRPLTLSDLMAYRSVTQPITLSCISNPIGGDLIGTSNWTGARLRDVLKDLGLRPEAQELVIGAADGFYESVAMEDMLDSRTLLVYGMNGETLPRRHGFPLRIYIPNRYGMKQPKWITRIEAIGHEGAGYWVDRGWSKEAYPQIISTIDTISQDDVVDGKIPIGGVAWAGDRGIQKVEVQVDDGKWVAATLRTPPLGPLTWVQWRYDWPMRLGAHTFRVRATDGSGALQIEKRQRVRPDGVTGYHVQRIEI